MGDINIAFSPYKTRTQIARELKITPHFLKKTLEEHEIEIPRRKQLNIEQQRAVYLCILGKAAIRNTAYDKK